MQNKDFEKELEDYFANNAFPQGVHFHRLPDSYSARGRRTVPPQPADFQFILADGIHFYVEVKEAGDQNKHLFKMWKLSESQYQAYEDSVELGFNFITLNYQHYNDTLYAVPAWLLRQEEIAKGDKTLDLNFIAQMYPWIVLNGKEDFIEQLKSNPLMRYQNEDQRPVRKPPES